MTKKDSFEFSNSYMYIALIAATLFWAGAFIAGKYSIKEIPPFSVAFLRFFFATLIIFPVMMKMEKGNWKLHLEDLPVIIFLGLIGMFGYHVFFFIALKYTTAINSSIIAASNPIMVNLLSIFFLDEKISLKRAGAILLSFTGVLFTITNGNIKILFMNKNNFGDLLMIIAVLCWAVYTIISRKVMVKYSPIKITTYSFVVAVFGLLPFFLYEAPVKYISGISLQAWASVIYMAIFPSVIGYLVQQIGIQKLGAGKTAVFINLVPVFSIILSVSMLGEAVSTFKLFSASLIIVGVYISTKMKS